MLDIIRLRSERVVETNFDFLGGDFKMPKLHRDKSAEKILPASRIISRVENKLLHSSPSVYDLAESCNTNTIHHFGVEASSVS